MASKPTLLFVHGAWHSPDMCWHKIVPLLQDNGYKCVTPYMLYTTKEPPVSSCQLDIEMIQSLIKSELAANNDVVMVGHSFGGLVCRSAVQGLTEKDPSRAETDPRRVKGIIAMTALLLPTGIGPNDAAGGAFPPFMKPDYETGPLDLVGDPVELFYHDLPVEEAKTCVLKMKPHALYTQISADGVYAGWLDVPTWHLYCTDDRCIPLHWQEAMVNRAREAGGNITTKSIDTGHSPFLVKPKETVDFILEALRSFE